MNTPSRLWAVPLGYLAASTVGALGVQASIRIGIGVNEPSSGLDLPLAYYPLMMLGLIFRAGLIASPFVLPVIAYAEWKRISSFKYFAVAGLALSLAISFVFVSWLNDGRAWLFVVIVFATPFLAAMSYWFVAWRIFAPAKSREQSP